MKKFFTLLFTALLATGGAWAQWTPSDKDFHIAAEDSLYGQNGLQTMITPDGNIVLTWYKTPTGMRYDNPDFGYYLHMQIYDKNGNAKFGKDGIVVCGKPGRTYTSNYSLGVADNNDILLSYFDTRDDSLHQTQRVYAYRYNQNGEPVWNADGIRLNATNIHTNTGDELAPTVLASGENIFFGTYHSESYNVKADSTNWQPSPWFPDDPMPDSIQVDAACYQLQRLNADGTFAWAEPKVFDYSNVWLYPAPNGNIYMVYINAGGGIDAQLIDKDGNAVWAEPAHVEKESISGSYYTPAPTVASDGEGGLMFSYRKLLNYTGYIVMNRLKSDGTVYPEALVCNGTTDGNGDNPQIAVRGNRALVAWAYDDVEGKKDLMVNEFDINGDYVWEGDSLLGYSMDQNDMWGMTAVKLIPQTDGWVVLYANSQSWNGANFYCVKIDDNGKQVWKRQIGDDNFILKSYSVVNDDKNAYFFYTCSQETDDDGNYIPGAGGLRVMEFDIANSTTGINSLRPNAKAETAEYYKVDGTRVNAITTPGLYIIKDGNGVRKVAVK